MSTGSSSSIWTALRPLTTHMVAVLVTASTLIFGAQVDTAKLFRRAQQHDDTPPSHAGPESQLPVARAPGDAALTALIPRAHLVQLNRALSHPAADSGLPSLDNLVVRPLYISSVDNSRRVPKWVLMDIGARERARNLKRNGGAAGKSSINRKNSVFMDDVQISELFRAGANDYRGSGLDRGHMMAAADAKTITNSQREFDDTFYMGNIVPQNHEMNANYWARLENWSRIVTAHYDRGYVLSGPLWIPEKDESDGKWYIEHRVIGRGTPPNIHVPTHLFKCVALRQSGSDDVVGGCFVLPNAPIDEHEPLEKFVVPVDQVEQLAGFEIFPMLRRSIAQAKVPICATSADMCKLPPGYKGGGGD